MRGRSPPATGRGRCRPASTIPTRPWPTPRRCTSWRTAPPALTLVFAGSAGAYGYGLPGDAKSVARALEGVHLDAIAVELQTAEPTKDAADHVAALVKQRGHARRVNIRFGHDALGAHTLTGTLPIPYRDLMPRFGEHVASLAKAGFKSPLATADGRIVHNAGGSEVQELGYTLAVAVAYLRALEGAGLALDAARQHDRVPPLCGCRSVPHRRQVSRAAAALGAGRAEPADLRPSPPSFPPRPRGAR